MSRRRPHSVLHHVDDNVLSVQNELRTRLCLFARFAEGLHRTLESWGL